jgi:holliday junction DNA helicase RuvA
VIASVRGKVLHVDGERAVVEVGGLGLEVFAAAPTLSAVSRQLNEEVYGFRSVRERVFFLWLIGVSGVGPKVALAVLSGYPVEDLEAAIAREDAKKFESIPGIGKKLAQRLVVELKDKVGELPAGRPVPGGPGPAPDTFLLARSALQNLGLTLREAEEALRGAPGDASLEDLVKYALGQGREA